VRSDGTIYFSDPTWQFDDVWSGAPEEGTMKVWAIDPEGAVTLVDSTLTQPNGVSLSPDEKWLYVAHVNPDALAGGGWNGKGKVRRYAVAADGSTSNPETFVDVEGSWPDGMTLDCAGNLYVATNRGVEVYGADKSPLGTITVGPDFGATNVAFGGANRKTLFITAERGDDDPTKRIYGVYSIEGNVPGLPY
jgi:gluconolactonase